MASGEVPSQEASGGLLLAIDSATAAMSVALVNKGKLLAEVNSLVERNHSVYLIPAIEEALNEAGLSLRSLQGIAVGKGPGSYTGVRIGITVAKTMAWTLKLPVAGVSSLETLAAGALADWRKQGGGRCGCVWVVPMLNARRGQAFTALFELREIGMEQLQNTVEGNLSSMWPVASPGWQCREEDGIRLMEAWADRLLALLGQEREPPEAVLFVGEPQEFGAVTERFAREAEAASGGRVRTEVFACDIHAEYAGYLGELGLRTGQDDDPHTLLPNYAQLAEAEVRLAEKQAK
ncbi:tRNA (adenosine(37)-N6)-threonylcarbamoyltransferase complex dimerization subunit type 1 TsaB [Paenibacillus sp. YN15]|nr:tRNA (adenosine(37)-N6)-threonylcarbamoyltransferase complex dimerization subunit type 1 TsaB [Paenibacillus sp. YN15]